MTVEFIHNGDGGGTASAATQHDRALVLYPHLRHAQGRGADPAVDHSRPPDSALAEVIGLAEAIDIDVVASHHVPIDRIRPATLFGSGKVAELGSEISESGVALVVVAAALTPVQQRNLERAWKAKVIDRTGLILEIFGERAQTREGELQVELAHLNYQRSRLVRSWTHLERQRGGLGFVGGPGETQIEADRRMIQERITRIKKQLESVSSTRELQRQRRKRSRYPVVAMVGYTNAGKSTLFNRLTEASVMAADMLFATLDPTMRAVDLPSGRRIILSDTVGFISNLPTQLIAAFRATLEEVTSADVILHVRDIAHPESDKQNADVHEVLAELGVQGEGQGGPIFVEALNKIDLLDADRQAAVCDRAAGQDHTAALSAATGAGCSDLLHRLDNLLGADDRTRRVRLEAGDGAAIAWLFEHGDVLRQTQRDGVIELDVKMDGPSWGRFESAYSAEEIARVT